MKRLFLLPLFLLSVMTVTGCASDEPVTFSELYSGGIEQITHIKIVDGGSGYMKQLSSPDIIRQFSKDLSEVTFTPLETDAGELNGMLYSVSFYENHHDQPAFQMTTNVINKKVYEADQDLAAMFESYYNQRENAE